MTAKYRQIKALIATAGARWVAVHFIKKDGSERVMAYNPKSAGKRTKGDKASPSAQQAVETRASNHPNLINVWDSKSEGFRSVNMDTIFKLIVDGITYEFPVEIK